MFPIVTLQTLSCTGTKVHNMQVWTFDDLAQKQTHVTNLQENFNNQDLLNLTLA